MTTSKATYTPQPRIPKAPQTKLISTENFYLEVERVSEWPEPAGCLPRVGCPPTVS